MRHVTFRVMGPFRAVVGSALLLLAGAASRPALAQGLDAVQRLGSGTGLRWPVRVASTRDGSLAFVLNSYFADSGILYTNAVASFQADPGGELEAVAQLHAGTGELAGLEQAVGLAVSPDDRFLYVGAMRPDHGQSGFEIRAPVVVTLRIEPDGDLEFRHQVELDAFGRLPSILVSSPDGRFLYVVASDPDFGPAMLVAFERDPATGALRQIQELRLPDLFDAPASFLEVLDLEVAPDGEHFYLLASAFTDTTILTLDRATATGRVTGSHPLPVESVVPELEGTRELSVSADGTLVFAGLPPSQFPVDGMQNRILVYRRDFSTGDLLAPRVISAPPDVPRADARAIVSPDALFAYQCLDGETLQVYRLDLAFGRLDPVQTLDLPPLVGNAPRCDHPRLLPDAGVLYLGAANVSGFGSLTRLARDRATGEVTVDGATRNGDGGLEGVDRLTAVVVSPDGRQVYALRRGWQVLTFRRDSESSGRLEPVPEGTVSVGGNPESFSGALVMAPDGRQLYVELEDDLVTLARNPETGSLRELRRAPVFGSTLTLSEDGRFGYAKTSPSTVTTYAREPATGELVAVQTLAVPASADTVSGGLALGPEGGTLYVASSDETSTATISILGRSPADGRLDVRGEATLETHLAGDSLTLGTLAVSPDGRHVYVSTSTDQPGAFPFRRIHLLDRDPDDGSLVSRSDVAQARTVRVSPNGRTVYALGGDPTEGPDVIAALLRDPGSGELDAQGDPPVGHLGDFVDMAVSPDGANLYAVGDVGIEGFLNRWFESPEIPGFRFQVSIDTGSGRALVARRLNPCLPGTVCTQGAVTGRTESLMRIVGPKPNGRLWPTLVKFSTSPVEVRIDQLATGVVRTYSLAGATPGSDTLPGLFDREGFAPAPGSSEVRWREAATSGGEPPPPAGEVFTSADFPGFRFHVRLTDGTGQVLPVRMERRCFEETLCVSGAVPGRSELFLRIVGPKPNGRLWPTIVRTTTSTVEVWIEQVGSRQVNYYRLEGATPGSTDLSGLFDRQGFLP